MQTNPTPERLETVADLLDRTGNGDFAQSVRDANAALAAFAEQNARLLADMQAIMDYFETDDGNAPGHGHLTPGVWDKDIGNGPKGGLICHWCKQWNDMRATLAALKDRTHG